MIALPKARCANTAFVSIGQALHIEYDASRQLLYRRIARRLG
ncbi:MAG: hypothetical protein PUP93_14690 [Rhizonema sp. NSF051]|nr:hypothetical protein [Rhizonema sp. NSF051]